MSSYYKDVYLDMVKLKLVGQPYNILDLKGDCKRDSLFCGYHYKSFCIGWTGWKSGHDSEGHSDHRYCGQWLAVSPDEKYYYCNAPKAGVGFYVRGEAFTIDTINTGPRFEVDLDLYDLHGWHPLDWHPVANQAKKAAFESFLGYLDHIKES